MIAIAPHRFEDLAQALFVRDVVTDQVAVAHGLLQTSDNRLDLAD